MSARSGSLIPVVSYALMLVFASASISTAQNCQYFVVNRGQITSSEVLKIALTRRLLKKPKVKLWKSSAATRALRLRKDGRVCVDCGRSLLVHCDADYHEQ